jgi:hypothetical protein
VEATGKQALSELWRNLIGSVSVLALSGVSYLAFAEPPLYEVLYFILLGALILTFVACGAWSIAMAKAAREGYLAIRDYDRAHPNELPSGASIELPSSVSARISKLEVPIWIVLALAALGLYFIGLREIPTLRAHLEHPAATSNQAHAHQPNQKVP